jgi:hypothetical protein
LGERFGNEKFGDEKFGGEKLRALILWLAELHAPLGHWTPLATSGLFAVSGLSHSTFLRVLAYLGALAMALLIGADVARPFVDPHFYPDHPASSRPPLTLPMLAFRLLLTGILGSIYTFLVFVGMGFWAPFVLLPFLFVICSLIAWRNVDLWYEQGAEFEQQLKEAEGSQGHPHLSVTGRRTP